MCYLCYDIEDIIKSVSYGTMLQVDQTLQPHHNSDQTKDQIFFISFVLDTTYIHDYIPFGQNCLYPLVSVDSSHFY